MTYLPWISHQRSVLPRLIMKSSLFHSALNFHATTTRRTGVRQHATESDTRTGPNGRAFVCHSFHGYEDSHKHQLSRVRIRASSGHLTKTFLEA